MTNSGIIEKFHQLECGLVFEKPLDLGFAEILFCRNYDSEYWNYAFTKQILTASNLIQLEEEFIRLNRKSTIYFENSAEFDSFLPFLHDHNYEKKFEDAWLFWEGEVPNNLDAEKVKKVETEDDLKIFLQVFDQCYQKDDPQNPYGELGGYLVGVERDWNNNHRSDRVEYFLIYKDDKPVAISLLINFEEMGYIANVGSLPEVRGEGFGKLATFHCIHQSIKKGNQIHFLSTEEGSYPFEFYQRIGFKKRFSTLGYTKVIE